MELNTQTINSIKNILCFPQRYGLIDIPLWRFFTITNAVTPQDKLYEQYVNYVQVAWPKVIFYIILRMMYKHYQGIDKRSGNFGYRLCFVTPEYSVSEAFLIWHKKTFLEFNCKNDPGRSKCINTILVEAPPIISNPINSGDILPGPFTYDDIYYRTVNNRHSRRAEAAQKRKNKMK